jgi:1-acyl-sn-glycerol-3-phosphate acyltransferase
VSEAPAALERGHSQASLYPRGFGDGHPFFVLTQWVVAAALRCMASISAHGMEKCPRTGPVIAVSNHSSYLDIPLLGAWAPRTTLFFSKSEVRRWPLVGWISATYGTVYVRRGESDRQAIRDTLACLAAGRMMGLFPEGTRSRGKGMRRALPGTALLAQRSGALVWPVGITGSEFIGKKLRPKVSLTGGEPFDAIEAARAKYGVKPTHQQVADTIMERVAALLPPEYRGVYAEGAVLDLAD